MYKYMDFDEVYDYTKIVNNLLNRLLTNPDMKMVAIYNNINDKQPHVPARASRFEWSFLISLIYVYFSIQKFLSIIILRTFHNNVTH